MAEVRKVTTPDRFILDINEAEMEYLMDVLSARPENEKEADLLYADLADAVYSETETATPSQVANYASAGATDSGTGTQNAQGFAPSYRC